MSNKKIEWKLLRGTWVSRKPVLPGVWRRREGGHVVRGRATDPATGKLRDLYRVMPDADEATALKWLSDEQARVRRGLASAKKPSVRFSEYAAQLLEQKSRVGDIRSARGRKKWADVLEHLITGTKGKKSGVFVPGFGDYYIDMITAAHVDAWRLGLAGFITGGDYAPTTLNGWLAVLKVIMKAAKRQCALPSVATEGVDGFDLSEHETYTDEEPNALTPEEVPAFLAMCRELHPAHYAMIYLGLVTGLRPSSLRPLRRRGDEADVDWEHGRIRVRRSHSLGEEVMRTTKQKRKYAITLPKEAVDVLRWHVATQLATPEQEESDLLFPAVNGKFRSPSVLNKPLDEVAAELHLGKKITQRALRRTFNDLARAAQVNDLVTRSISGHLTERMQHHYSTVNGGEQRDALAKVVQLFNAPTPAPSAPSAGAGGEESGEGRPAGGEGKKKAG